MKQLLTIFMVLVVTVAFAQRPEPIAKILDAESTRVESIGLKALGIKDDAAEYPLDTLLPGNWENRVGVALYQWADFSYFVGHNHYGDLAYGQQFPVGPADSYYIYGALYWLGYANGDVGEVIFTIWDWDDDAGTPGEVVLTTTVDLEKVTSSASFDGAFFVSFLDSDGFPQLKADEIGTYVVGVDLTGLEPWEEEYGIGNISTSFSPNAADMAWCLESNEQWAKYTSFNPDYNMDLAIFPLVSDEYFDILFPIEFNLNMTFARAGDAPFNPANHDVYITGSMFDWPEPGSDSTLMLTPQTEFAPQTVINESFSGGGLPDGWGNVDRNNDGRAWKVVYPPAYTPNTGNYAIMSESWSGVDIPQDNWLITPQIYVAYDNYNLSFYVKAQDPGKPAEKYSVLVSTTTDAPDAFTAIHTETLTDGTWKNVSIDLEDYVAENIYIAFRHFDSNQVAILLDDIVVTGTPESMYSITFPQIEEGTHEYKYFIVVDGEPSWEYEEWPGDPNRGIFIGAEVKVMNDVWGKKVEYDLTLNVVDEAGEPIEDAFVTIKGAEIEETEDNPGVFKSKVIEGEMPYFIEKKGYVTETGVVFVDRNTEETITLELIRTLTFNIVDEDEEPIEDAVVTFDGVTNPEGVYVFENLLAGTYEYVVTHPDFINILAEYKVAAEKVEPNISATVTLPDIQLVTFNVDMTGAKFNYYGTNYDFDPADPQQSVFLTGPGFPSIEDLFDDFDDDGHPVFTAAEFELDFVGMHGSTEIRLPAGRYEYKYHIVYDGMGKDLVIQPEWDDLYRIGVVKDTVEFYDWWQDEDIIAPVTTIYEFFETGQPVEGWANYDHDGDGFMWKFGSTTDGFVPKEGYYVVYSESWDAVTGTRLEPDNWLLLRQLDIVEDDYELIFSAKPKDPLWPEEHYSVMISTVSRPQDIDDFDSIVGYTFPADYDGGWRTQKVDLADYAGHLIYIAIRHHHSTDQVALVLDQIIVDRKAEEEESAEGTSIDEIETIAVKVYPNPVRDNLTLRSEDMINNVQLFDIAGRIVFDANIDNKTTVIDVSNLNLGVYILRIHTNKGLEHHKIQVTR